LQRAFTKLKIAAKDGPAKGWYDKIEHARKTDELLIYVRHARNADEHGVEEITQKQMRHILMKPKDRTKRTQVDYVGMRTDPSGNTTVAAGPIAMQNLNIEVTPSKVVLIPVRDRGSTYQPPAQHLGMPITPDPIEVARLALAYLEATLADAEQFR
jgi:hypothetical protein